MREDVPKLKKDFKNATLYQLLMQIKPLLEEDADYIAAFDEHFRQVTVGNHQDMPLKIEIQTGLKYRLTMIRKMQWFRVLAIASG